MADNTIIKEDNIPIPGQPVRGSQTGRPIMALFDLLGRSWAMGIIWNLNEGACTFRELQTRCESVSPTTLNSRLKELKQAHLIERSEKGYCLTILGKELFEMLDPLGKWSVTWAENF